MLRFPEKFRIEGLVNMNGPFLIKFPDFEVRVIASTGAGWEHVSVSLDLKETPSWSIMCFVKSLFWEPEDVVMELHPAASKYINIHPFVLHLWRPLIGKIPLPLEFMV